MFYLRHFHLYFLLKPGLTPENMQRKTAFIENVFQVFQRKFQRRYLKFLLLLFTLSSFLFLPVFPLFCREFFLCFSICHLGGILDLLSQLIQSNQRTLKFFNQWEREDVANQMSRNCAKCAHYRKSNGLFTNKHLNGFRNGCWNARSLFFQRSVWFLPRFSRGMWRLRSDSSRVVAVTMPIWLLWEIFLSKLWISLSKMWRSRSPRSYHLLVSRQARLSALWWM